MKLMKLLITNPDYGSDHNVQCTQLKVDGSARKRDYKRWHLKSGLLLPLSVTQAIVHVDFTTCFINFLWLMPLKKSKNKLLSKI